MSCQLVLVILTVIRKVCPCNEYPLKPQFYIVKTVVYLFFLFLLEIIDCGLGLNRTTPYIRLVKFQLVRQIPDVYVSACVLAGKLFLLFFLVLL